MRTLEVYRWPWLVLWVLVSPQISRCHAQSFAGVGVPPGISGSLCREVSSDGAVAVGRENSNSTGFRAFRWTAAQGRHSLDCLPWRMIDARGVSADGFSAVGDGSGGADAILWSADGDCVELRDLFDDWFAQALKISSDGAWAVGEAASPPNGDGVAVRWSTSGTPEPLGTLPGDVQSAAYDVSADGSVVVGESEHLGEQFWVSEAFRWTNGGMMGLGILEGYAVSGASGVSADGTTVVGLLSSADGLIEGFRWTDAEGMVGLGPGPGGTSTVATSVSGDGSIIVGYTEDADGQKAFIWDSLNGVRDLKQVLQSDYGISTSGWKLVEALAISDDGTTIVGYGTHPHTEGWIARLGYPVLTLSAETLVPPVQQSSLIEAFINGEFVPRKGLTADGESRVWLCCRRDIVPATPCTFSDVPLGEADLFLVAPDGTEGNSVNVDWVQGSDGVYYAWCLVRGPEAFDRGPDDSSLPSRISKVAVDYGAGLIPEVRLELHRAPVLLVHGLHDNPGTWVSWPGRASEFDFGYAKYENDASMATGAGTVWNDINRLILDRRRRGISCRKADLVAHSLGAPVSRYMMSLSNGSERVRRFVTIGGIHRGSDIANLAMALSCEVGNQNSRDAFQFVMRTAGRRVGSAVRDLQEQSPVLASLPPTTVPSAAIAAEYGSFGEPLDRVIQWVLPNLFPSQPPLGNLIEPLRTKAAQAAAGTLSPAVLFDGQPHDGSVETCSQEGGCGTTSLVMNVEHGEETDSPEIQALVSLLLKEPDVSASFGTFEVGSYCQTEAPNQFVDCQLNPGTAPTGQGVTAAALHIGFQPDLVAIGDVVTVTATPTSGFNPDHLSISVIGSDPVEVPGPPFELVAVVTPAWLNEATPAMAIATDDDHDDIQFGAAGVAVVPNNNPDGLTVWPRNTTLFPGQQTKPVIIARYDTTAVLVVSPAFPVEFTLSDQNVATIDSLGAILALSPGETTLSIGFGALADTMHIRVPSNSGACVLASGGCFLVESEVECDGTYAGDDTPCDAPSAGPSPILPENSLSIRTFLVRPNPVNRVAVVEYELGLESFVRVLVFDIQGRRVRQLSSQTQSAGTHSITWDGTTDTGHRTVAGAYYILLEAAGQRASSKVIWID